MSEAVKVLLVEDDEADAELVRRALARTGLSCEYRRVQTEPDFRRELDQFDPQIVLSDFGMPQFNGLQALQICKETNPDIPFIFVSGTIGEDTAVEAMRAGSFDYVMKSNLKRLGTAVQRELREAAARRARRVAEAGLRRAQLLAKLAHVITGPDGEFETWSDTLPALTGVDAAALPRTTREWLSLVHPDDQSAFRATCLDAAAKGARSYAEYRIRAGDNAWKHIRQVLEPLEPVRDGTRRYRWFNTLQDITGEALAQQKIIRLNRVYAVLSGINTLIVRVRDREELLREACRIAVEDGRFPKAWIGLVGGDSTQFRLAAAYGGEARFFEQLERGLQDKIPTGRGLVVAALAKRQAVISNDIEHDPEVLLREDLLASGTRSIAVLPLVVAGSALGVLVLNAEATGFFDEEELRLLRELAGDISFALEHIELAERMEYLAYYDPLTGLANRTLFFARLATILAAARGGQRKLGLVVMDIERFRSVNEALGRQGGDALLKQISERMLKLAPDPGRLAHIGADHFAVAIPDVTTEDDLARRCERRLHDFFGEPYRIAGAELQVSAKLGIAMFPNDGQDAEALFRNAEAALKKAKQRGERYLFYEQQMTERVAEKLALESRLRKALEQDEFVLHYQPKVTLQAQRIVGVEALIRWQNPELGLVPPARFIPLLEESGLILQVGSWALRRAALDHRGWVESGIEAPRVAVNVSPIQLRQRNFVAMVERSITEGAVPCGVDIELTESLLMEDVQGNIEKLKSLRELGINIAIDDFGTGYSSLGYLARLPVQALKIDRSFIATMHDDANAMTLVSTIISLAHSLGLKVVAEGVETEEQAKILRLLRCDEKQGYLFSKPLPMEQLVALLKRQAEPSQPGGGV